MREIRIILGLYLMGRVNQQSGGVTRDLRLKRNGFGGPKLSFCTFIFHLYGSIYGINRAIYGIYAVKIVPERITP